MPISVVPNEFLVVGEQDHITFVDSAGSDNGTALPDLYSLYVSDASISRVDYDAVNQEIIWADTRSQAIYADDIHGGRRRIVARGFTNLWALAVDWVGRQVYFSDHDEEFIGVATLDGRYATIVIQGVDVTSIALDPERG